MNEKAIFKNQVGIKNRYNNITKFLQTYIIFKQFKPKKSKVKVQQLILVFLGCKHHFRLSITVSYTFWVDDTNKSNTTNKILHNLTS